MKRESGDHYCIDVMIGNGSSDREHRDSRTSAFSPPMDIYEDEKGIFIEIELPGVDGSQVKVIWENGRLVCKGRKKFEKGGESFKYYLLERPYGSFDKIVEIPGTADSDNINARMKDGVMQIFIPYRSKKSINIECGGA